MRIGVLTSLTQLNAIYRGLPLCELAARGHDVVLAMDGEQLRPEMVRGCDVVHVHRFHEARMRQIAEDLRAAGTAIVWDNDDDLTEAPGRRGKGALESQRREAGMRAMIRLADVVTTPSAVLADQYRAWGAAHVEVVENYLPASYAVGAAPPHDGVRIGWAAALEHRFDLVELGLREVLIDLLDARPDVHVVSVGLDLGLPSERYRHQPRVQYPELGRLVAGFDVGIAPLADVPFNRARSNVKLKEYAAAGVPWLASPVGPYAGLGRRQGGELAADGEWPAALDRLARDARRRRKLAARGRKWAAGQTVAANLSAWERALTQAVERSRLAPAR